MSDIGKSLHISWKELACKDGTQYPVKFIRDGRVIELIVMFERIRQHFSSNPIKINSAYRTISYNKSVGGSPKSQHIEGKALDIRPPIDVTLDQMFKELKDNSSWMGIKGLGKYKTFIHVDIRNVNKLIVWDLSK